MDAMDKAIAEVRAVREHDEAALAEKTATDIATHRKLTGIAGSDPERTCECLYAVFLERKFIARAMLGGEAFSLPKGVEYMEAITILDGTIKKALFL